MKKIRVGENDFAIVDDEDFCALNKLNWSLRKNRRTKYAFTKIGKKCVPIHRLIIECPDDYVIDHKDGDGLNNLKENLRVCTKIENSWNRRTNYNNKCGFKGVYYDGVKNRYRAYIKKNKKRMFLGTFVDKYSAAIAYDVKAIEIFGEYAKLNILELPK